MTYALLDDGFYDHPSFVGVPNDLIGAWAKGLAYCCRHLTDGAIPERVALSFFDADCGVNGGADIRVSCLISVGLWARENGSIYHVGYLEHNQSKREVLARRKSASDRKNAWKKVKAERVAGTRSRNVPGTREGHDPGTLPNPIQSNPIQSNPNTPLPPASEETKTEPSSYDLGKTAWAESWRKAKGSAYSFAGPLDRREDAWLRWLGEQGGDLAGVLTRYFALTDDEIVKAGHPLAWLQKRFNGLRGKSPRPSSGLSPREQAELAQRLKDIADVEAERKKRATA
jgi:hypothetical protein